MCTVSNIGDSWRDSFPNRWGKLPGVDVGLGPWPDMSKVTRQEFEDLKNEIKELKELLKAAKKFDEATGQKDCEMDDKVAFIRKIADAVGVDMEDVFKK